MPFTTGGSPVRSEDARGNPSDTNTTLDAIRLLVIQQASRHLSPARSLDASRHSPEKTTCSDTLGISTAQRDAEAYATPFSDIRSEFPISRGRIWSLAPGVKLTKRFPRCSGQKARDSAPPKLKRVSFANQCELLFELPPAPLASLELAEQPQFCSDYKYPTFFPVDPPLSSMLIADISSLGEEPAPRVFKPSSTIKRKTSGPNLFDWLFNVDHSHPPTNTKAQLSPRLIKPCLLLFNHLAQLWLPLRQDRFLVLLSYILGVHRGRDVPRYALND